MVHLFDLLALLCELPLTSFLRSLWSRLGIHDIVPPSETARIIADKAFVVNVVMFSTGPERKEMVQAPREFITTVGIDSLKEAADDPEIHCQDVELASNQNPKNRSTNSAKTENHDFNWRRVFGGQSEWSRILMMDLVDVLIKRTPMHCAVRPVMPSIL